MGPVNLRIVFEITKVGALSAAEEQQARSLKLQLSSLQQKGLAHSSESVFNGLDSRQVLAMEAIAIEAVKALNEMGQAELEAKNASRSE